MIKFSKFLNKICYKVEEHTNLFVTSFLVGFGLFLITMLYVCPNFTVSNSDHGYYFSLLSQQPFDFTQENPLRYRILTPLIGYILNIPQDKFLFIPLSFAILFIGTVYYWYRKKNFNPCDAVAMAAIISFSSPILISLVFNGFTDTTTYFFLLLCFINIRNSIYYTIFFILALFNHECTLFLLPALFVYKYQKDKHATLRIIKFLAGTILALFLYIFFRLYITENTVVGYNLSYYFGKENIQKNFYGILHLAPLGIFFAFKIFWHMPLIVTYLRLKEKKIKNSLVILIVIIGAALQLIIACDTTRLLALAFPAILFATEQLRSIIGINNFTRFIWTIIILNLFIPQYNIIADRIFPLFSPFIIFFSKVI